MTKTVLARELPADWRSSGQFEPDERVVVSIEPEAPDPELAAAESLLDVMNIIGRRAQARGLTEDKLREILAANG